MTRLKPYYVEYSSSLKENRLSDQVGESPQGEDWRVVLVFFADSLLNAETVYGYLTREANVIPCCNSMSERNYLIVSPPG